MEGPNLKKAIDDISADKGIKKDILIEAIEAAMLTAVKKVHGIEKDIEARYNDETGGVEIFEFRTVVEQITSPATEIKMDLARDLDPEAQIGDSIGVKLETDDMGRIAAQTAKQVIIQRVREAERENIFNEYSDRKSEP